MDFIIECKITPGIEQFEQQYAARLFIPNSEFFGSEINLAPPSFESCIRL